MRFIATLHLIFFASLAISQSTTTPTHPTHPGSAPHSNAWYTIQEGDTCYSVTTEFGITQLEFIALNPAVSEDCETNFWLEYSYCVGTGLVPDADTTQTTTTATSTTSTSPTTLPT